ncbi:MAG: hypothetical protein JO199_03630 [Candidatus Eremiobacteraeota bacterium]|nr:hypothetical protein [Candidatus Eremiobacteraeota bacterium]
MTSSRKFAAAGALLLALAACSTGNLSSAPASAAPPAPNEREAARCSGPGTTVARGITPSVPDGITVPNGFAIRIIADVAGARQLVALPDGDLLAGTRGSDYYIVPDAEAAGAAGAPNVFATIDDSNANGIAFAAERCTIVFATEHGVWTSPYAGGDLRARRLTQIAKLRSGPVAPGTDGDVHVTSSVAYAGGIVYASAGSSCDATMDGGDKPCTEVDPTRAAISQMHLDGSDFKRRAHRIRNAVALTIDPLSGALWAGDAGQDRLAQGHPYEFLDDVSAHPGDTDYGWPECEEDHRQFWAGYSCAGEDEPRVELPAYSTIVGAAFYPLHPAGPYAFPARYRGALFASGHGSWHSNGSTYADPPRVVWIPMKGDEPAASVDWKDPAKQWRLFAGGFLPSGFNRIGRPVGIAVGPKGSLFVADDQNGVIYRIRPTTTESSDR